ncbi:MAG: pimelyl-ACP methyl ester esterase BioV [Sulfurovum sp.]|nr:pimelyl-ACP methyl ester esterase BioV [Sulfurovum sp.]
MKYFSGFSLQNEETLFKNYICNSDTTVVGFSYGAQKAFDYAYETENRVDRLILLSPAFFQNKTKSFKRMQLHYFESNQKNYIKQFLINSTSPSTIDISTYLKEGTYQELTSLLNYQWSKDKIDEIINRGISIEVFLGSEDKIIDSVQVNNFFSFLNTYMIHGAGHLLKEYT